MEINSVTQVNDSKLYGFTLKLFVNRSSTGNNFGALSVDSAKNINRLLKVHGCERLKGLQN